MLASTLTHALHRPVIACLALVFSGVTAAQDPAAAQAEQAMSALSARYQQIWPTLSASERQAFSAQERAWLNRGRWDEQKECVALDAGARVDDATRAAQCQQQVVQRRLQQLQSRQPLTPLQTVQPVQAAVRS